MSIYLDNAATTRPNQKAVEKALCYLNDNFYNPSGAYKEGQAVKHDIELARKNILNSIANEEFFDLIFTSCGTESDNQALFTFAKRGNIVTTYGEHSAIFSSSSELKNRGIEVRYATLNQDGSVNVEHLFSLIDEKTTLVSVIHINNETGAINDINSIAKKIKEMNPKIVFHSDGVQAFGKIPFKLSKNIDLYSISGHKIGGLKGTGALFKRKTINLRPFVFGGGQETGLRSGTENVFGIKVLEEATKEKFLTITQDWEKYSKLREKLWNLLDKDIFIRLSAENSSPYILSIAVKGIRGQTMLNDCDDNGLIIGNGSACSTNAKTRYSRVILQCGYDEQVADGVIRLSFSNQTTEEEIIEGARILNFCAKERKNKMNE